jgi:hypothetical protein
MKESSKERYAQLLMAELLDSLGERESLRAMLGDMVSVPVDELIRILLDDFEKAVARRRSEMVDAVRDEKVRVQSLAGELSRSGDPPPRIRQASPSPGKNPPAPPAPVADPRSGGQASSNAVDAGGKIVASPGPAAPPPNTPAPHPPAAAASPAAPAAPARTVKPAPPPEPVAPVPSARTEPAGPRPSAPEPPEEPSAAEEDDEFPAVRNQAVRVQAKLAPEDIVYFHAIAPIPEGEEASPAPFFLEEKGILQRELALAIDRGGLRFYVSRLSAEDLSVSRNDLLLLPKAESLALRGVHTGILNDLRNHGTLLPFEFGTVVRGGKDEAYARIDNHLKQIRSALEEELATRWWTLTLSVLDAKIERLVGESQPTFGRSRERERESLSKIPAAKKFDIKVLERMLQKEKKLAEAVHRELENLADRCDVEMMIDLGGGSSEDWKQIFKASYEVPRTMLKRFHRTVADLQYQHMLFDLMLQLEGNRGSFSFGSPAG